MAQARRAGLERWHLEGASWRRLGPGPYVWAGLPETPALKLETARLRLPASAAFSGKTAAWLHGLDVAPADPIEAILPGQGEGWERGGVRVRRVALDDCEVVARRGWPKPTPNPHLPVLCGYRLESKPVFPSPMRVLEW
jgi:hypothetical protein